MQKDDSVQANQLTIRKHLPPHFTPPLTLASFKAGWVHKKQAHFLINTLRTIPTPLDQMSHLKRIRKSLADPERVEILLYQSDDEPS